MNIYFYNSYNLSPLGYQLMKILLEEGSVFLEKERFPKSVLNYFTHAGANAVCYQERGMLYFIMKGLTLEDSNDVILDTNRKWFINLAIEAEKSELPDLKKLILYLFCQHDAFCIALMDALSTSASEFSYLVDIPKLSAIIEGAIVSECTSPITISEQAPVMIQPELLLKVVSEIAEADKAEIFFACISSTPSHFRESYKLSSAVCDYWIDKKGNRCGGTRPRMAEASPHDDAATTQPPYHHAFIADSTSEQSHTWDTHAEGANGDDMDQLLKVATLLAAGIGVVALILLGKNRGAKPIPKKRR